jgi:anti-sigma factor RsiW
MNCDTYDAALGDYVDGTIDTTTARTLAAHLASCSRCRALAEDLGAIRSAAQTLEPQAPPARTWHRIAAAVEEDGRARGLAWLRWQPLASAAVLLVSLATWWMVHPATTPPVPADTAGVTADESRDFDLQSTEEHYQSAIAGLEQIAIAGGDQLDPQTADILKVNLTVIDTAIGESRAALQTEPASDVAQQSLFTALNTKLALLQDTVALINEMRQGDQDGANGIASGLNQ